MAPPQNEGRRVKLCSLERAAARRWGRRSDFSGQAGFEAVHCYHLQSAAELKSECLWTAGHHTVRAVIQRREWWPRCSSLNEDKIH